MRNSALAYWLVFFLNVFTQYSPTIYTLFIQVTILNTNQMVDPTAPREWVTAAVCSALVK